MPKPVSQLLDELQEKVGSLYAGMHGLDDAGKQKREKTIQDGLTRVREHIGPEGMKEAEQQLKDLEPKVRVVQPRELNSNEPVPDISERELGRYYLLKKLLQL